MVPFTQQQQQRRHQQPKDNRPQHQHQHLHQEQQQHQHQQQPQEQRIPTLICALEVPLSSSKQPSSVEPAAHAVALAGVATAVAATMTAGPAATEEDAATAQPLFSGFQSHEQLRVQQDASGVHGLRLGGLGAMNGQQQALHQVGQAAAADERSLHSDCSLPSCEDFASPFHPHMLPCDHKHQQWCQQQLMQSRQQQHQQQQLLHELQQQQLHHHDNQCYLPLVQEEEASACRHPRQARANGVAAAAGAAAPAAAAAASASATAPARWLCVRDCRDAPNDCAEQQEHWGHHEHHRRRRLQRLQQQEQFHREQHLQHKQDRLRRHSVHQLQQQSQQRQQQQRCGICSLSSSVCVSNGNDSSNRRCSVCCTSGSNCTKCGGNSLMRSSVGVPSPGLVGDSFVSGSGRPLNLSVHSGISSVSTRCCSTIDTQHLDCVCEGLRCSSKMLLPRKSIQLLTGSTTVHDYYRLGQLLSVCSLFNPRQQQRQQQGNDGGTAARTAEDCNRPLLYHAVTKDERQEKRVLKVIKKKKGPLHAEAEK